ncbi:hypothetical protein [Serratia proteamaculans]
MTLTTEAMQEIYEAAVHVEATLGDPGAEFDLYCKLDDVGGVEATIRKLIDMVRAANREAQPVAGELGEIRVGRLPTMNQEEYPGLGDWWVQLRIGENHDEILARVYGATPEEAVARARLLTATPAPAVPEELLDAMAEVIRISDRDHEAWRRAKEAIATCRTAMLAAAPTQGEKQ